MIKFEKISQKVSEFEFSVGWRALCFFHTLGSIVYMRCSQCLHVTRPYCMVEKVMVEFTRAFTRKLRLESTITFSISLHRRWETPRVECEAQEPELMEPEVELDQSVSNESQLHLKSCPKIRNRLPHTFGLHNPFPLYTTSCGSKKTLRSRNKK